MFGNGGSSACGVHCVELTGGVELATPVKKGMTGPVETVVAGPCALEGRGGREARWRGRKMGYRALARWRCRLTKQRRSGECGRGALSRRYGEVRFFKNDWGRMDE